MRMQGILVSAAQFNPALPIRDENGNYSMNSDASFLPNPVSLLDITDKTTQERLLANAFFEVRPIDGLLLKANFGIDRNYQKTETIFANDNAFMDNVRMVRLYCAG